MHKKVLLTATAMVAALVLSACSEAPKTTAKVETEVKKEPAKAPEAVTAKRAFYEMYKPARTWATDLLALSVVSGEVPNIKNEDGNAGLWTVVFVSPSRREARSITYAVVESGDIPSPTPWWKAETFQRESTSAPSCPGAAPQKQASHSPPASVLWSQMLPTKPRLE